MWRPCDRHGAVRNPTCSRRPPPTARESRRAAQRRRDVLVLAASLICHALLLLVLGAAAVAGARLFNAPAHRVYLDQLEQVGTRSATLAQAAAIDGITPAALLSFQPIFAAINTLDLELLPHDLVAEPAGQPCPRVAGAVVSQLGRCQRGAEMCGHFGKTLFSARMGGKRQATGAAQVSRDDSCLRLEN